MTTSASAGLAGGAALAPAPGEGAEGSTLIGASVGGRTGGLGGGRFGLATFAFTAAFG